MNPDELNYHFGDVFVYDKNPLFAPYPVHLKNQPNLDTNYYMISFNNTRKINCKAIKRFDSASPDSTTINTKCLELSALGRDILRRKLAHWYGRIPDEDKQLLGGIV